MSEQNPKKKAKTTPADAPKESINEAFTINQEAWTKALDTPWKHHGFGGPNRRHQGLCYEEPNFITCKVCDNVQVHWHRLSQHIAGTKHASNLEKCKSEGMDLKDSDEDTRVIVDEDELLPSGERNINAKFNIDQTVWKHAMEAPWRHRGVSGKNKLGQGLQFTPPNHIVCTICDNTQIHFHRLGVHIAGQRHIDRMKALKSDVTIAASVSNPELPPLVTTDVKDLEEKCIEEVKRLHSFLVGWFTGAVKDKERSFQSMASSFATDFHMISPDGNIMTETEFLDGTKKSYGCHKGPGMVINMKNPKLMLGDSKHFFVFKYEEFQTIGQVETGKVVTVVFRSSDKTANGLEWAHVHETLMAVPGNVEI